MTFKAFAADAQSATGRALSRADQHWPLWLGLTLIGVPTLYSVATQSWTTELGAHGLIVFCTGVWLLVQGWPCVSTERPGHALVTAAVLVVALPVYAFGRAYGFISLEAIGLYLVLIAALWRLSGSSGLRTLAFPIVYLGFLIPPPGWVIDRVTAPLQDFVSMAATSFLSTVGYPVARTGVAIFIAQYQLLVEQACSGMNSLLGLTAIMLFYIYMLHRSSWGYALTLLLFILPIAVVANIIRVMTLVLIAYYLGDEAAQGFLHMTAGVLLFAVALVLAITLDSVLRPVWLKVFRKGTA